MAEIGKPIDRVDGRLKVTGAAKYAAEFNQPNMTYAFPVRATVAKGTITSIDASAATDAPGVVTVLTHLNAPRLKAVDPPEMMKTGGRLAEYLLVLQDNKVHYFGQFVALVVAETYEQARHAAALMKVEYAAETPKIDLRTELPKGFKPEKTVLGEEAQVNAGKAAVPLAAAPVKLERTYTTPIENHHPMEPHATVAVWEGDDKLTLYDATQGVMVDRAVAAFLFDLKPENVRVLSPFLGGGFGGKGLPYTHFALTVMAARVTKRPVKLVITRQMMQTNVGRRSATIQKIALGASRDGKLSVIRHHSDCHTNFTSFFEPCGAQTEISYGAPLREITYQVAKLDIGASGAMRAPGDASGTFASESAMDELAFELKIDPLEFRVLNHTAVDPLEQLPFSSEHLLECYRTGAEKFGWSNRKMQPRAVRRGRYLVGYGTATATYHGRRSSASVRIKMAADGAVVIQSATQEIGTGTYTILTQTAADALGIPMDKIAVEIGDSNLPPAPISAGSQTAASVNPAILAASEMLRASLLKLAIDDRQSKLNGRRAAEIAFADAKFFVINDASLSDSYADIMRRNKKSVMEACATTMPIPGNFLTVPGAPCPPAPVAPDENSDDKKYSFHSFGAQFVEVWVDEQLGTILVKRVTGVHDVGRILNEKTARSQIIGGVIFGIGQALMEETVFDRRWANPVQRSFADYHVPVQLDVPEIDVQFIGKPDPHISPIGARGAGEIGGVGIAAAIANAVFNATGKRIRDLPLTPDKLL